MISSKKRRQGSSIVANSNSNSNSEAYSRTLPRPSDIARNLATPTYTGSAPSSSSSSTAVHHQQQAPPSRQTPVSLTATPYGPGKQAVRAVANPYDDLSLYAAQINAVHKPEIRTGDPNHAYRGRVSATSGGYFGYNKPVDGSGHYGYNKPVDGSGHYGYNKPVDGSGHYGYNKPVDGSGHYGYNKPVDGSGHYGYNKPDRSNKPNESSDLYGYNKHAAPRDYDGRFGYNNKPSSSNDTRGYYGFNKPTKHDTIPPNYYGYSKSTDTEPKGQYGYTNKPTVSDPTFSDRYGLDRDPPVPRRSKSAKVKSTTEPTPGTHHQDQTTPGYSMTLPWSSRYGKPREPLEAGMFPSDPPQGTVNPSQNMSTPLPSFPHGLIYEGHTHCPSSNSSGSPYMANNYEEEYSFQASPSGSSGFSPSNHLHQFVTSTPKHRPEAPTPPGCEDYNSFTASPPSAFSTPSTIDYTATLPAKLSRSGRAPQAPPHLHIRCDLASRFYGNELADQDQQRSQSMSPRVFRTCHTGHGQSGQSAAELGVRETKTPPASAQTNFDPPTLESLMGNMYDAQRHLQGQSQNVGRSKRSLDPGNQGSIPAPPKQAGLAATLNYHQQLRKELGMPQSSSPVPHPPLPSSSSAMASPFKFQQHHHLSDSNIPSTTATTASPASGNAISPDFSGNPQQHSGLDRDIGLLTSLAYDGNSRRFHDAFQNLHGLHNSTPHLPSATLTTQSVFDDQPLFGSDPNLLRKTRQAGFDTFYDNIFFGPQTGSKKTGYATNPSANATYPPVNPSLRTETYQSGDETNRFLAQFDDTHPGYGYTQASKSSSDLPTSGSAFSPLQQSQKHQREFRDWSRDPSTSLAQQPSSSLGNLPFPKDGEASYYSSTNVHGLCTLPRNSRVSPGPTTLTKSLAQKEPSYEEITNITPAPGKGANSGPSPLRLWKSSGRDQVDLSLSANEDRAELPGNARSGSIKARSERLPGSVSDRAHKFEQKASGQGETKKKTGIPTFTFVKLRSKTSKTEKQDSKDNKDNKDKDRDNKSKEKSKAKREIRDLDRSFEKEEKRGSGNLRNDGDRCSDQTGFASTPAENSMRDHKTHRGDYGISTFAVSSFSTHPSPASGYATSSSSAAAATISAKSSVPLLTFSTSSSSSSSPPRQRMSNPEDAGSKQAAFLAVTGSDVTAVAPARGQQTSSMHETGTGSGDVDSFSDFLLASGSSHNYHLFSRRKKPLPASGEFNWSD
ncbi:hypothetical protein EGW08_018012 [Elysia chlorotica]|uniref:Uncharacterized protein n=1 Tax=Elysia chlorotica TaxID=188477 RepID=A0A433SY35_ELYCH|nr:hypothetical protein EGW08_018012 [Elysia chlorotica]